MLTGRWYGGTAFIAIPSIRIRPSSGVSKPAISRSNVVLPQPEGPSSAKNSPRSILSETPSTATVAANRLLTALMSRSAIPGSAARLDAVPHPGPQPLVGTRRRPVEVEQPAHRIGRIDAGIIADLSLDQRGRRQIRVR